MAVGSSPLPENYGLQDQAAVLGWTQENIALFRGDPTLVTVGADRNGADVTSLHLSSSSSSSYFQQALLMVRTVEYLCPNYEMMCETGEKRMSLSFHGLRECSKSIVKSTCGDKIKTVKVSVWNCVWNIRNIFTRKVWGLYSICKLQKNRLASLTFAGFLSLSLRFSVFLNSLVLICLVTNSKPPGLSHSCS